MCLSGCVSTTRRARASLTFLNLRSERRDSLHRSIHRPCSGVGSVRHTLDRNDLNIDQADETQCCLEIRVLEVQGLHRAVRVDTAARKHEVHFLTPYQAFRSFFGVSKGSARTKNVVDVALQRRGNAEVDHPGGQNNDVRCHQFRDQLVRQREHSSLRRQKLFARRIERSGEASVDMLERITRKSVYDKGGILMFGDQFLCQGMRDLSRIGSLCAWTGSDKKNLA